MSFLDRALEAFGFRSPARALDKYSDPFSLEELAGLFNFQGLSYPFFGGQLTRSPQEVPNGSFESYITQIYKRSSVVFACMSVRSMVFAEARFQFQRMTDGRPGDLFGGQALDRLERPWPNGTTGDLLARMIQDVDIGGNSYTARVRNGARRMRPDWTTIVMGSQTSADDPGWQVDAEVIGYIYQPGGSGGGARAEIYGADEVAHFAPYPDPHLRFRGMTPMTPLLREAMGDNAAQEHKLKFFENGATPNFAVSLGADVSPEKFEAFVAKMESKHKGLANAYKTLYLAGGATAQKLGADFQQIDFKRTIGAGETRIAAAFGTPPIIVGLSEGLESATYSNYDQALRRFAGGTMRPLWRNAAASLETIVDMPKGRDVRLWYDDRDIPFLKEDVKDAAEIIQIAATSIDTLIRSGFKPDRAVKAVMANDLLQLAQADAHTGLFSVQLQPPGTIFQPTQTTPATPATPALSAPPKRLALGAGSSLTPREQDVALRVARGLSNKQIAAELHLTERTIEHHVASAIQKLGVSGRVQLATAMAATTGAN